VPFDGMSAVKRTIPGAQLVAVARLFSVLSEPNRLGLVQALRDGPLTVSELVEASGMKPASVSKHLGLLHHHRLMKRRREGICVRYEVLDPAVFVLCKLTCGKVGRDARRAGQGTEDGPWLASCGVAVAGTVLMGYKPGQHPKTSRKATVKWLRLL
jgi:DNA-binding transcriptional ArsR family regulator